MGQKMGRKSRLIYDRKYYKVERISGDKHFKARIRALQDKFASFGCAIPKKGFASTNEYFAWHDKLGAKWGEVLNSKPYKAAVQNITGGKMEWGQHEQDHLGQLEDTMLPPVAYGPELDAILEDFGLNPKDKNDEAWIEGYLFFNRKAYPHPMAVYKLTRNKDTNEWELWVRYFGHTQPNDIDAAQLTDLKRYLPDYIGKNRPTNPTIAARNKMIVEIYLEQKKKLFGRGYDRSLVGQSVASKVVAKLRKKYPSLTPNLVLKIVRKKLE